MAVDGTIIEDFINAVKTEKPQNNTTHSAVVSKIDNEGTVWVYVAGSDKETPTSSSASEVKKGDAVNVEWRNNKLYISGNYSNPAAGTQRVAANEQATMIANMAAQDAIAEANTAHEAAESAKVSAVEAKTSANEAKVSAREANTQATYATNYANNALIQLSTVESVVDTLNWITEHSTFIPTTDTTVHAGKIYYVPANNTLTMTDGTYELNGLTFVISGGTVTVNGTATAYTSFELGTPTATAGELIYISGVTGGSYQTYGLRYAEAGGAVFIYDGVVSVTAVSNKKCYIHVYGGYTANNLVFHPRVSTTNDGYEFEIVDSPSGNPSTQNYYELDTTEAVRDFVKSHLSLTNDGLYVLNDASAYKMLLANNGMYIQAPNGQTVNQSTTNGNVIKATDGTVIAHLGYGEGNKTQIGTGDAPYYTFGTRKTATQNYSTSSTYAVGDMCIYNNQEYVCILSVTTPGAWNSKNWTLSDGNWSVAEGTDNICTRIGHVEGENNINIGSWNHIEGINNRIIWETGLTGDIPVYCHVGGSGCTVTGNNDGTSNAIFVHGIGLNASDHASVVFGRYNASGLSPLTIGNGTSNSNRSNALRLDFGGDLRLKGDVYVGCNANSSGGTKLLSTSGGTITGSLAINNHSSAIGTVKQAYASAKSVSSGTNTNLTSISLEAGTWVITGGVRFPNNGTGFRRMNISTTSASEWADVQLPALSGASTQLAYTVIVSPSSTTTYYLNCYHNAGSALSLIAGGGENGINFLRAVRIA